MTKFQIYIITNDVNDKVYIGQTTNSLKNRLTGHCYCKTSGLYKHIQEIGKEHFKISLLDDTATNLDELLEKEQYFVRKYDSIENGYNTAFPCKTKGNVCHNRIVSTRVNTHLLNSLKKYSEKTSIPLSKLFDKAIEMYLDSVSNKD